MSTSRALDRHPDLPEKSFIQKVYGEPTTRSGVVEGWDAPPPTIVSDDFQVRRAAGLQSMADADRFAAMSNAANVLLLIPISRHASAIEPPRS